MLDSLEIKNFRGFKDVKLEKFGDINIIVGDNASGKTTFLEAVFLSLIQDPYTATFLKNFRFGDIVKSSVGDSDSVKNLFIDLFYNLDVSNSIVINSRFKQGDDTLKRELCIQKKKENSLLVVQQKDHNFSSTKSFDLKENVDLDFIWKINEKEYVITPTVTTFAGGQVEFQFNPQRVLIPISKLDAEFYNDILYYKINSAGRFSNLLKEQKNQLARLLNLEFIDAKLRFNNWLLCIKEKNSDIPEEIPAPFVSAGLFKILNIAISALTLAPYSILLIDEIENGIYYTRYPFLLNYLNKVVKERKIQIFMTTHSKEFVNCAKESIKDDETEFCLIKADNHKIDIFNENILEALIKTEKEMR